MRHFLIFSAYFVPALAMAANGMEGVMQTIISLLNTATTLLIGLAVVYLIWGIVKYMSADNDEKRTEGRKTMIHGIIALFVMVSIWGIIGILQNTFSGVGGGSTVTPGIPGA